VATSDKKKVNVLCSSRFYFCDSNNLITHLLETVIVQKHFNQSRKVKILPHMRFLYYEHMGSSLAPHVDLCRVDEETEERSTHTFILYLSSCLKGGETVLLKSLISTKEPLAIISPECGRLLLFPHMSPHMGNIVEDVPKLLLRGEAIIQ